MEIRTKNLAILILPNEISYSWIWGFRLFKFSYFKTFKFPRFISRNLNRLSFIIYYIKTFLSILLIHFRFM